MSFSLALLRCRLPKHYVLRHSLKLCSYFSSDGSFEPFEGLISRRRNEAQCSMLVEVPEVKSASDLYEVCSEFGTVKNMFHYRTSKKKEMILVEYEDSSSLKNALSNIMTPVNDKIIPVHSPLAWLSTIKARNSQNLSHQQQMPLISEDQGSEMNLLGRLHLCGNISDQMQTLYDHQKLTELGWRRRFFTCRQVEIALSGLFPNAAVLPFGSSVNTFGRYDCDLDMTLELTDLDMQNDNKRLVFQTKTVRAASTPRFTMLRHMEAIFSIIDNFVPGCHEVLKILGARVPIIKYNQHYTEVKCDLTMGNRQGFYMSELLYLYGCMDHRVRPLVFTIRSWAKDHQLTSTIPGRWITNFSLTLLVLFYLMRTSPPTLPSLHTLTKLAGSCDKRETQGINCTFLRDLRVLTPSENKDSLEILLKGFFEFYSKFNFKERGISLLSGSDFIKPVSSALYIQNPLEDHLNVSRNVNYEELDRLLSEIENARYHLEGLEHETQDKREPWGILHLCGNSTHPIRVNLANITIDWKEFFPAESENVSSANIKNVRKASDEINTTDKIIDASNLNGLVTELKVKMKNTRKKKKGKGTQTGKFMYRWDT